MCTAFIFRHADSPRRAILITKTSEHGLGIKVQAHDGSEGGMKIVGVVPGGPADQVPSRRRGAFLPAARALLGVSTGPSPACRKRQLSVLPMGPRPPPPGM